MEPTTSADGELVALREALLHGPVDLSRAQLVRQVAVWIRERTPAAVVRFGEGEGRLLVANPNDDLSVTVASNKLERQTGVRYSTHDVLKVKALVMNAFDHADVVGIRGSPTFLDEHKMWVDRIERLFEARLKSGRAPAFVSHCLLRDYLGDKLPALLITRPKVSVISCRDVGQKVETAYGLEHVRVYQVPSQYIMRAVDESYEAALHGVRIWPEFYNRLRDGISVRERGEVFLVGAGVFGKDLCIRIRELGGIALDVGAFLDQVADKMTRGPNRPEPYREPH